MPRLAKKLLDIQLGIAECPARFFAGQRNGIEQLLFFLNHAHAPPAATASGLDDDGIANVAGNRQNTLRIGRHAGVRAGHARHTGFTHGALGRNLVAHHANTGGAGADEGQAGLLDTFGERGVFRQKPVAGMDRLSAGQFGRVKHSGLIQVTLPRRSRPDAQ
ncbi:hypothetical protein ALP75_203298 [Pseudomonas syringae pv. actinidiae]|nr:hypothetical protein ALP75_203298 [Pseudomonas syringae pv. actinidiae]